jgi:hypothetical protein
MIHPQPPNGYRQRPPSLDDAPAVAEVIAACQLAHIGGVEITTDELLQALRRATCSTRRSCGRASIRACVRSPAEPERPDILGTARRMPVPFNQAAAEIEEQVDDRSARHDPR